MIRIQVFYINSNDEYTFKIFNTITNTVTYIQRSNQQELLFVIEFTLYMKRKCKNLFAMISYVPKLACLMEKLHKTSTVS